MSALHKLTATEIVSAVDVGRITREAVVRALLDRISAREPEVQAWQHLNAEQVIAEAQRLDKTGKRGPLMGVPFGIKDIIDTCDMPTEYGSAIYAGHQPRGDAACVALSRRAGGILIGKTVTTEFAQAFPGKTRNPFDSARTPGGSSSGSAAAVGDCMVPLAIGTQTTGSTIRPASFCGVFGYRPTPGDLRVAGMKAAAGSLDSLGLFARSIEDIALYRDVLLGVPPEQLPDDDAVPRIGFCRTHLWPRLEPTTQKLLEDAAERLARCGATVASVALPADFEQVEEAVGWIASFERARNFTWEIETHWDMLSDVLRNGRLKDGLSCTFERYQEARILVERCGNLLMDIFAEHDVLLTAPALGEAPVGLESTGDPSPCIIWSATHVPALTIPVFTGPNGLPVGAQVVGMRNHDRKLFSAARWIYRQLL